MAENSNQPLASGAMKRKSRVEIILDWCKKYRGGDMSVHDNIKAIADSDHKPMLFLMAIAFSAGRRFQYDNPDVDINEGI